MINDFYATVDSIAYLLNKFQGKPVSAIRIIKLLCLADKYSVLNWGDLVTASPYSAMKKGLVADYVKEALNVYKDKPSNFFVKNNIQSVVVERIEKVDDGYISKFANQNIKKLSKCDKQSIDFAFDTFGHYSDDDLIEYIHHFPEWQKHEATLNNEHSKKTKICFSEFFTVFDDKFGVSQEDADKMKEAFCD